MYNSAKLQIKYICLSICFVLKQTDLVTVLDAILTSRPTCEKFQCLYENLMSNDFRKTAVSGVDPQIVTLPLREVERRVNQRCYR